MPETPLAIATMNNSTIYASSAGISSVSSPSTGTYQVNFDATTQSQRTATHDAAIICLAQTPSTSTTTTYRLLHKYEYHYSTQSYAQIAYRRYTGSGFGTLVAPGYHTIVVTNNQPEVIEYHGVLAAGRFDNTTLSSAQHGITSLSNIGTGINTINFETAVTSKFTTPETQMPVLFQHYIDGGQNTFDQCYSRNATSITLKSINNLGTAYVATGSIMVFNIFKPPTGINI
jgi:hypothetical protein